MQTSVELGKVSERTQKLHYYDLEQNMLSCDEGCSELLDETKQAKLQLLQMQRQINGDDMNDVTRETSTTFRKRKREYLKDKINDLETDTKNKHHRCDQGHK
jgi:hypothetical protein